MVKVRKKSETEELFSLTPSLRLYFVIAFTIIKKKNIWLEGWSDVPDDDDNDIDNDNNTLKF